MESRILITYDGARTVSFAYEEGLFYFVGNVLRIPERAIIVDHPQGATIAFEEVVEYIATDHPSELIFLHSPTARANALVMLNQLQRQNWERIMEAYEYEKKPKV